MPPFRVDFWIERRYLNGSVVVEASDEGCAEEMVKEKMSIEELVGHTNADEFEVDVVNVTEE